MLFSSVWARGCGRIRWLIPLCLLILGRGVLLQAQESSTLPVLLQMNVPLTQEQWDAAAHEVVTKEAYLDWSLKLGDVLTTDYQSGNVDQKPWIARLRMAQALDWLATNEIDYARKWMAQRYFRGNQVPTKQQLIELIGKPEFRVRSIEVLGDETNIPRDMIIAKRFKPETLEALLGNPELMDILGQTVTPDDYLPGVWRVLSDLQEQFPDKIGQFPALAVALAVDFDQGFLPTWPHSQVKRSALPYVWENWKPLFDYFTQAQSDGTLLTNIQNLRADQLKFMVDAPIDVKELVWANQNVKLERGALANVYSSIVYNLPRLKNHEFFWSDSTYRLEKIKQEGGICVDQAYYSVIVGKAKGLPTLLFTGQGLDGGHAWFGYLVEDDKWNMNVGRYKDEKFVSGTVFDPQTGRPISDHELAFLSDPGDSETMYNYARNITFLAQLPSTRDDPVKRRALLTAALNGNPKIPMVWEVVERVLKESGATDELMQHYQKMADQFTDQDDIKITALARLLPLQRQAGLNDAADQTEEAMLDCRSDLAIRAAAGMVSTKISAQQYEEGNQLYQEYLNKFTKKGQNPGADLFVNFVEPVVMGFQQHHQHELAQRALDTAEKLFVFGANDDLSLLKTYIVDLKASLAKDTY